MNVITELQAAVADYRTRSVCPILRLALASDVAAAIGELVGGVGTAGLVSVLGYPVEVDGSLPPGGVKVVHEAYARYTLHLEPTA